MVAFIWRLCIRHSFFATGHACSFNKLQFSAAFVAFETFHFVPAGISLFFNTFGWDLLGISFLVNSCHVTNRQSVLSWFCFYQLAETVVSCISVSIMKRHLMVWAIFAPRFVFSSLFLFMSNSYYGFYILAQPRMRREHAHRIQ
jgi:phosphatidylinositol glycan class O